MGKEKNAGKLYLLLLHHCGLLYKSPTEISTLGFVPLTIEKMGAKVKKNGLQNRTSITPENKGLLNCIENPK